MKSCDLELLPSDPSHYYVASDTVFIYSIYMWMSETETWIHFDCHALKFLYKDVLQFPGLYRFWALVSK